MGMASQPQKPTDPDDAPSNDEMRARDCDAKAAYCKWVTGMMTDPQLRDFYAELSSEWEKEAAELKKETAK